jgi:hypothetical protein
VRGDQMDQENVFLDAERAARSLRGSHRVERSIFESNRQPVALEKFRPTYQPEFWEYFTLLHPFSLLAD